MTNFRSYRQPSDLEAQDEAIKMSGIAHVVMPGINPRPGFEQARVEDLQFWSQVVSEREGNEPYSQLRVYAMYKAPHPCDELAPVVVAGDTIQRPWMIGASDATLTLDQLQLLERLALNLEGELGGIGTRLVRTAMPVKGFHPTTLPQGMVCTIESLTFTKVTCKREPGSLSDKFTLPREAIQQEAGYFSLFNG
jgi:hypothetical protein